MTEIVLFSLFPATLLKRVIALLGPFLTERQVVPANLHTKPQCPSVRLFTRLRNDEGVGIWSDPSSYLSLLGGPSASCQFRPGDIECLGQDAQTMSALDQYCLSVLLDSSS